MNKSLTEREKMPRIDVTKRIEEKLGGLAKLPNQTYFSPNFGDFHFNHFASFFLFFYPSLLLSSKKKENEGSLRRQNRP